MKVRVILQRSDNVAEDYGLESGQRELVYPTNEGNWIQFSFGALMDQSWTPIVYFDSVEGLYRTTDDDAIWSDIILSFEGGN